MKFINTRIEDELFDKAKAIADSERRPVSSFVRNAIQDAIEPTNESVIKALRNLVYAAGRVRDNWAESDKPGQQFLWRNLHETADAACEVLDKVAK